MQNLFVDLDALSNFRFTPRPVKSIDHPNAFPLYQYLSSLRAQVTVSDNLAAILVEEVVPMTVKHSTLLAPEGVPVSGQSRRQRIRTMHDVCCNTNWGTASCWSIDDRVETCETVNKQQLLGLFCILLLFACCRINWGHGFLLMELMVMNNINWRARSSLSSPVNISLSLQITVISPLSLSSTGCKELLSLSFDWGQELSHNGYSFSKHFHPDSRQKYESISTVPRYLIQRSPTSAHRCARATPATQSSIIRLFSTVNLSPFSFVKVQRVLSSNLCRFCTTLCHHKTFAYEQYKLEYCFVNDELARTEVPLNEIQLYRRPFAYILFTVCHTSDELRAVLDEYAKGKQSRKNVFTHLFVRYRTSNEIEPDAISNDEKLINGDVDES